MPIAPDGSMYVQAIIHFWQLNIYGRYLCFFQKFKFYSFYLQGVSPSGMKMAVKFEEAVSSTLQRKPVLYYDQQFLHFLSNSQRCQYVPLFYDYGRNTNFYYMVMDLLGPSLIDVLKKAPKNGLSSKTKLLLCIGMLHAVHEVLFFYFYWNVVESVSKIEIKCWVKKFKLNLSSFSTSFFFVSRKF